MGRREIRVDISLLVLQVISGAIGGNVGGAMGGSNNMGISMNSLLGAVGGAIGGQGLGGSGFFAGLGNGTHAVLAAIFGLGLVAVFGLFRK
jgi:hypothetical protein